MSERRAFSAAVFAVRGDGKVLLIKHKLLGLWLPVGGEVESGETPLEAAARELREETGLVGRFAPRIGALDGEPDGFLGYEEHDAGSKGRHLNFNFLAFVDSVEIVGDGSFTEHRWHEPADIVLPGPSTPSVEQYLNRVQKVLFFGWFGEKGRRS